MLADAATLLATIGFLGLIFLVTIVVCAVLLGVIMRLLPPRAQSAADPAEPPETAAE